MHYKTLVILGNGFDRDLGIDLSFNAYCRNRHCIAYHPEKKLWSNFENDIRQKILSWDKERNEESAKEINSEWIAFKKNFSYFFTDVISMVKDTIDNSSYAYNMLKSFSKTSSVYTFNYTYPYEYVELDNAKEFTFVHGRYYCDSFRDDFLTMSQSPQMIVGIDCKRIPINVKENAYLSPIVKQLNSHFVISDIEESILTAKYVVFFGFSMSITDADYFDEYFSIITSGKSECKTIFYITFNEEGFENFQRNIEEMGYDYQTISNHIQIIPIFTDKKLRVQTAETFKQVLSLI